MNRYIILLAALVLVCSSCKKEEGQYFDPSINGIYFETLGSGDALMQQSRNFADYVIADSSKLVVRVKVVMLGYTTDYDRKVAIKSKALEDLPMADIEFPSEVILPAGKSTIILPVTVNRPPELQTNYGAIVYIDLKDGASDFDEGIDGQNEVKIISKELFEEPITWESAAKAYFGDWNLDKHFLMLKLTNKQDFYNEATKYKEYNRKAVDSTRLYYVSEPADPKVIGVPFYVETDPNVMDRPGSYYKKPHYWGSMQDQYLGFNFDIYAYPFTSLWSHAAMSKAYGVTTATEAEFYKATEENMKKRNKEAVKLMMTLYNEYYNNKLDRYDRYQSANYLNFFHTIIFPDTDYELVRPAQWEGPAAALTDPYYGEYSDAKYRFMIKVLIEKYGNPHLPTYFPVIKNANGDPEYCKVPDPSSWPTEYYPGWQDLKKFNKMFKDALAASGETEFSFPNPPADPVI